MMGSVRHTRYLIKPQRHPPNQHLSSTQAKTPDKTDRPRVSLLWRRQRPSCSDGPSSFGPQDGRSRCAAPCPAPCCQLRWRLPPPGSSPRGPATSGTLLCSLVSRHRMTRETPPPPLTTLRIFSSPLTTSFLGDRDSPVLPWSLSGCQVQKELEYCVTDRNWELAHGNKKLIYELHGTIHSTRQEFNIKIWL